MRAGVPIVPIAVVGAEEAMPTFAQVGLLKRLSGLLYFPITPLFPHFGLLGATYLPAKFSCVSSSPWRPPDGLGAVGGHRFDPGGGRRRPRADPGGADRDGRAAPVGRGSGGGRRVLITGLSTYWGGRLAQALEQDAAVEVIVGVSPDPTCELTRTEFVRVGTQHALLERIVSAADIDT